MTKELNDADPFARAKRNTTMKRSVRLTVDPRYRTLGFEELKDIRALCRECHSKEHPRARYA